MLPKTQDTRHFAIRHMQPDGKNVNVPKCCLAAIYNNLITFIVIFTVADTPQPDMWLIVHSYADWTYMHSLLQLH